MLNKHEEEFNELVKNNHASIYRICRAYLYDLSYADDLYQDILFQLWKSVQNFKGESKVSTWVYRIAVNSAINFNKKNKNKEHITLPDIIHTAYEETLAVKIEQEQQEDKMRYCISLLEPQDRLIISLVLEDKSYKEITEITGNNHVGVKINRIKGRLLKLMQLNKEYEL